MYLVQREMASFYDGSSEEEGAQLDSFPCERDDWLKLDLLAYYLLSICGSSKTQEVARYLHFCSLRR